LNSNIIDSHLFRQSNVTKSAALSYCPSSSAKCVCFDVTVFGFGLIFLCNCQCSATLNEHLRANVFSCMFK